MENAGRIDLPVPRTITCLRCHNLPCKAHAVALHHLTTDCERLYRYGPPLV